MFGINRTVAQPATRRRHRAAITILELLVTLAVVSLLAALLLPAIASAREAARRVQCAQHLRQLGLALHNYHETWNGLPPGWQSGSGQHAAFGWAAALLPQLEQPALSGRLDSSPAPSSARQAVSSVQAASLGPAVSPAQAEARRTLLAVMLCPSDHPAGIFPLFADAPGQTSTTVLTELPAASYVGVYGTVEPDDGLHRPGDGAFVHGRSIRFAEFARGMTQTLIVGERTAAKLPSTWLGFDDRGEDAVGRVVGYALLGPNRPDADECEFDSRHPGSTNFLWADGRVEAVADGIEPALYQRLARRAYGNP